MNIAILIPAYNTEKYLPSLIDRILSVYNGKIIIIYDGSINSISYSHSSVDMLKNEKNMGKGYSLLKGMRYAFDQGFDAVITIDSDGQHDPKYITNFLNNNRADIVIGTRKFDGNMPFHRRLSNTISSKLVSMLAGVDIPDSQSGYRMYLLRSILSLSLKEEGFQFESEVLICAGRKGYRFNSIPISTLYSNEDSNINSIMDTLRFIRLIIVRLLWS